MKTPILHSEICTAYATKNGIEIGGYKKSAIGGLILGV